MVHATTSRIGTEPAVPKRVNRHDRPGLADREGFLAWALLLPSIIYIVALVGLPLLLAIAFSFSDVTAGDPSFDWDGLANYRQIFDDPVFWQSLRNTMVFTVGSMVLIVVFGKVLANILVADFRGKWIVRLCVLLPWTTPVALSAIAWLWLLDSIFSPIDWMLRQVGWPRSS
jgi:multiple sugar transport system permease protein